MMLKKKGVAAPVEKSAMAALDTTANKVFNQQKQNEKPQIWCDCYNKLFYVRDNCWKIYGKHAN